MTKLTGKKFLLLLLYTPMENTKPNAPISGRTRLMKMGFLFKEELLPDFKKGTSIEISDTDLPEFFSWNYGPFSKDLLNDLEFLINQEYVSCSYGNNAPLPEELAEYEYWVEDIDNPSVSEYQEQVFQLMDKGICKVKELWQMLTSDQRTLLTRFKTILNKAPLDRILDYVYKKYKDSYTDKSLIREKYLS
jgi:uncharacterized protein